jgi:hypothetical protein
VQTIVAHSVLAYAPPVVGLSGRAPVSQKCLKDSLKGTGSRARVAVGACYAELSRAGYGTEVMRVFQENYGWNPIESAPFDEDVTLQVTDGRGGPYRIPYPCKRTASGWVNSSKGTPLAVTPVKWKPYAGREKQ